jgi:hypothetical protein
VRGSDCILSHSEICQKGLLGCEAGVLSTTPVHHDRFNYTFVQRIRVIIACNIGESRRLFIFKEFLSRYYLFAVKLISLIFMCSLALILFTWLNKKFLDELMMGTLLQIL